MQAGISGRPLTNLTQLKKSITDWLELRCDKVSTLCQKKKKKNRIEKPKKTRPPAKPNKHTKLEWSPSKFVLWFYHLIFRHNPSKNIHCLLF